MVTTTHALRWKQKILTTLSLCRLVNLMIKPATTHYHTQGCSTLPIKGSCPVTCALILHNFKFPYQMYYSTLNTQWRYIIIYATDLPTVTVRYCCFTLSRLWSTIIVSYCKQKSGLQGLHCNLQQQILTVKLFYRKPLFYSVPTVTCCIDFKT